VLMAAMVSAVIPRQSHSMWFGNAGQTTDDAAGFD